MYIDNLTDEQQKSFIRNFVLEGGEVDMEISGVSVDECEGVDCEIGNHAYIMSFCLEDSYDENPSEVRSTTVFDIMPNKAYLKFMIDIFGPSYLGTLETVAYHNKEVYSHALVAACEKYYREKADLKSSVKTRGLNEYFDEWDTKAESKSKSDDVQMEKQ